MPQVCAPAPAARAARRTGDFRRAGASHRHAKRSADHDRVVFSRTLTEAPWPKSTIARGDLAEEIAVLKAQPGGEIIAWGGAGFAQALSRAGLIDQYAIVVQPVVYGGGKPIFSDLRDALHLKLLGTTYSSGTMLHLYEPHGWGTRTGG
jgi:dihydrofolate reductase